MRAAPVHLAQVQQRQDGGRGARGPGVCVQLPPLPVVHRLQGRLPQPGPVQGARGGGALGCGAALASGGSGGGSGDGPRVGMARTHSRTPPCAPHAHPRPRAPPPPQIVLSSDEAVFGGFSNVSKKYDTTFNTGSSNHDNRPNDFCVYAPSRTVVSARGARGGAGPCRGLWGARGAAGGRQGRAPLAPLCLAACTRESAPMRTHSHARVYALLRCACPPSHPCAARRCLPSLATPHLHPPPTPPTHALLCFSPPPARSCTRPPTSATPWAMRSRGACRAWASRAWDPTSRAKGREGWAPRPRARARPAPRARVVAWAGQSAGASGEWASIVWARGWEGGARKGRARRFVGHNPRARRCACRRAGL